MRGSDGRCSALELSEVGADPARLEELTGRLRSELLDLDVNDVERVSAGNAPEGSKAIELAAVGALIVTMEQSGRLRGQGREHDPRVAGADPAPTRAVEDALGDRTIELTAASNDQQDRLVAEFIRAAGSDKDAG